MAHAYSQPPVVPFGMQKRLSGPTALQMSHRGCHVHEVIPKASGTVGMHSICFHLVALPKSTICWLIEISSACQPLHLQCSTMKPAMQMTQLESHNWQDAHILHAVRFCLCHDPNAPFDMLLSGETMSAHAAWGAGSKHRSHIPVMAAGQRPRPSQICSRASQIMSRPSCSLQICNVDGRVLSPPSCYFLSSMTSSFVMTVSSM
jgi:hypothetical protein